MVIISQVVAAILSLTFLYLVSLWVRGRLTLDLGHGRSVLPLGPITVEIDAPRDMVYETIARPYLGRTPKSMRDHIEVFEKGDDYALAAHYTSLPLYTAVTLELLQFEEPSRVDFYHVRGPVPYADESFELTEIDDETTELEYTGELGVDFWIPGRVLGKIWVVPTWEKEVTDSLENTQEIAENRWSARKERMDG